MSSANEADKPTDLTDAIEVYRVAISDIVSGPLSKPRELLDREVLTVLLARDEVARLQLAGGTQQSGFAELDQIARLDRQLKDQARTIIAACGQERVADWRGASSHPEGTWWWFLDDFMTESQSHADRILTYISWILIAVALSFILEILRRFMSGGTDLPSIVVQGLLGLLAGGVVIQWAKRFVEVKSQAEPPRKGLFGTGKARLATVLILIFIGGMMEWARPKVARLYNNWGARLQAQGQVTTAMQKYQRALNLGGPYSAAHYNMGRAYEDVLEYDQAMVEYKNAILADERFYAPYNNLARLYIVHRGDYVGALRLIDKSSQLEIEGTEEQRDFARYAQYKNRGWANFGLKNYSHARDDLLQALTFYGEGAEAYCVLAEVLEAQKAKAEDIVENWRACIDQAAKDPDKTTDPVLVNLARERLR